jgi:hypothetical protein
MVHVTADGIAKQRPQCTTLGKCVVHGKAGETLDSSLMH